MKINFPTISPFGIDGNTHAPPATNAPPVLSFKNGEL
jgi:hypothetical protein